MSSVFSLFCHRNVRSFPCHLEEGKSLICLNDFDLFAMSEMDLTELGKTARLLRKLSNSPL